MGMVVVLKLTSVNDRLERKIYMGMWRWESEVTARMRSRFPRMVTRYMDRKSPKRRGCRSGSSESLRRKNCETRVRFCGSMKKGHLFKEKRVLNKQHKHRGTDISVQSLDLNNSKFGNKVCMLEDHTAQFIKQYFSV